MASIMIGDHQQQQEHIQSSALAYVQELSRFLEDFDSRLFRPVDYLLWEGDELWDTGPERFGHLLKRVEDKISRYGIIQGSGRTLSFIPNSSNYATCLAEILLSQLDVRNSTVARNIENVVLKWMCKEMGYPSEANGHLTTGGTPSTVVAVATAREAMAVQPNDRLTVYMTSLTHVCVDEALLVAGLGQVKVRIVEVDGLYRMNVQALEEKICEDKEAGFRPFLVIATFGTTDCGSIDPVEEIAEVAADNHMWLHVDAAYGGFLMLCQEIKDKAKGMERADSIVIDAHKTLHQPYGSSAVLFKNGSHKDLAMGLKNRRTFWSSPLEENAMPRGFSIWFSLNAFGVSTFRKVSRRNVQLAAYAADLLRTLPGVTVLPVDLSTVAFRCHGSTTAEDNARTRQWWELTRQDGRVVLTNTSRDGEFYIRIAVNCIRSQKREIEFVVQLLGEKLAEVFGEEGNKDMDHPNKLGDATWISELEANVKDREMHMRNKYIPLMLDMLHDNVFSPAEREDHVTAEDVTEDDLWPSEEPIRIEKLIEITRQIPLKASARPDCHYAGALGQYIYCVTNTYTGLRYLNPGAVELEQRILEHLACKAGMPEDSGGVLASDCRTGNILALHAARFALLGDDRNRSRPVVYTTRSGMESVDTPLAVLGLSHSVLRIVGKNSSGTLDASLLKQAVSDDKQNDDLTPWVVVQALSTDEDSEDQHEISAVCEEYGLWHHVQMSRADPGKLWRRDGEVAIEGLSNVDSLSLELGSSLCQPVGIAAILVSDHNRLRQSLVTPRRPQYMVEALQYRQTYEPWMYSFELTRPCRAMPLWFTLSLVGSDGIY